MTYNNPQHNTNKYSCTPFPILKEGDTSGGIVTYLDLVDLGSISGFGVNLTEIGGTQRWDNTIITNWQTLFNAINEHLTIFNARLQELEQSANPDAITIISKSNNQLEANVNNVTWSSSSPQIIVNPTIGQTTTYSLASSATSYGSFTLTANRELIEEGESITITAQWTGKTTTYDATITATKSGMTPATKSVQLPKEAICPTSVTLDNGKTIALNSSGRGTLTYTPSVGNYTVKTQGNETPGSCSFTVAASQPTTTYYWYVGTTLPTAANLLSIATGSATSKPDWSTPYSIAATNNTGESSYMYYCFPAEWNVMVLDSDRATEVALAQEGTITVNNITYNIQRTGRKISNGTSKDYYAIFNNGEAITITSKSNNQLEANVDNVNWSSDSSYIDVNPKTGKTTTYSLTNSATSYGSFTLTASESSIEEGESITITAQWYGDIIPYSATITATKAGMKSATKQVQLPKEATCPASVTLDNGKTITLNSSGYGTLTYTPSVGSYTIRTQGNETSGSCSFTVNESMPKTITITSKSGNQLEANVDNVSWSSDSSYINVYPETGQTTTYSLSDSATSYGSFTLNVDNKLIEEGESITITAQWYEYTTPYSATITATKSGMTSATKFVQLSKAATCPSYVYLDNGARITLDSNGRGTYTYTPTVGNYTIRTQGNETQGSCSFTVNEVTPVVEPVNADIVAVYNIQDTSKSTKLSDNASSFKAMEIDGVVQPSVVTSYKFDRHGNHTIKYELNGSNIGDNAFDGCSDLRSIDILNSVTSIGEYAFDNCTGLASCTIGNGVTSIGNTAFNCCSDLSSITIGNSVTSIGDTAFAVCNELTSIDIPNSVTSIGEYAFQDCSNLTSITLSNRLTKISNSAFEGCSSLTSIDIPDGVTNIDDYAFNGCSGLTNVTIGSGVTRIGGDAFYGCSSLTSIDIPDSVTKIGERAFENCTSLINVTSHAMTAPDISNNTFRNVKTGGTLTVSYYSSSSDYNDVWLSTDNYYLGKYNWNMKYYDEPETITITSKSNNQLEANVDNVNWSSDSSYIDVNPTTGKTTTYSLNITPYGSFELTASESSIEEGESITITAQWTGHSRRYSATITASKPGMISTRKEVQLFIEETCPAYVDLDNGARITLDSNGRGTYTYTPTVGSYTIRTQGNETSGSCSFTVNEVTPVVEPVNADLIAQYNIQSTSSPTTICNNSSNIKAMEIDGVVQPSVVASYKFNTTGTHTIKYELNDSSIGDRAFENCSRLTSIDILDSVTSIGTNTFDSCSSLTSIDIPDSVTSIDDWAFYNCTSLTSVTLSNRLTEIGENAFYGCSDLTSIDIPDSVTSIGGYAFYYCSNLTSVTLSNNLTEISDGVFSDCSSLTSIDIPDSVTSIGSDVFYGCNKLTNVDIPESVTSIGSCAFYGCNGLTSITSNAMTAPKIQSDTFQNVKTGGTLTVPYGSSGYDDTDDTWLSTSTYYLGYYDWNIEYDGAPVVEPVNADLIAQYNIQSTSSPTTIFNNGSSFKAMEIDGVVQPNVVASYKFNTTGTHTIKYELNDSSIGDRAFADCSSLTSVDILDSVTSIDSGAFYRCSGLTSIDIPDSVTSIDDWAFYNCTGLTSVTIGNSVTSIGGNAFAGCGLTSVDIPDSVTSIGNYAFNRCSGLTSVTIGNGVTRIGQYAFSNCSGLTSIVSNAMTAPKIQSDTFQNVKTGGTLTVPYGSSGYDDTDDTWLSTSTYYLGYYDWNIEYDGAPETITITSKSNNQLEANVDNVSWSSDSSYINVYPETGQTTTYSLSSSATSYGSFTLTTNKSSIQEGESIAITAQWHNNTTPYSATITATKSGMTPATKSVQLSKNATCPASVTLDNGQTITLNISSGSGTRTYTPTVGNYTVTTKGNETPGSCSFTVVAAVNVNADLIAYYNVQNISSPTAICINNGDSFKSMEIDGVDSVNITTQGEVKYQFNTTGAHTIKYELNGSSIGNGAFSGNIGSLTSVDILDSVTSIGDGAFAGRSTLTSIDIPNSVTSIGSSAFAGCSGLTSIDIPDSVTSIGDGAFHDCRGLTSCTIGSGVTSIGSSAFASCSRITSIDIPDSVTSISNSAFSNCSGLTSCTIGSGVTSIGNSAFYNCSSLTSIDIPDNVTSIDTEAFNRCSGLTSVTIGNGVTRIGQYAFSNCSGLTSIVSNAMTAPNISNNTFQNVKNNGRLTISYYSSGYDTWLSTGDYFLGKYDWVRKYDDAPNVEPINEDIVAYYNIQDTSSPTTICDNRGNKFKSMEIDGVVQSSVVSSYQFNTTGTHTIKYELNDSNIANGAFSTCTSLTSCTIADSVTSIGMGAFAGCSGLTSIDIPDSVTSIGTNAFSGCSSLTSIVCNAMTAPNISSSTFASIATDGTLTVPTGSSGYDVWLGEGNYYLGKYGWHSEPM